jgi:4'-phosphopantetheinyl transferase
MPRKSCGGRPAEIMKNSSVSVLSIELFLAELDVESARNEYYRSLLSPDEQRRAERYHYAADRSRFITARGVLRTLLGSRLSRAPESLRFEYGANGKPALEGGDPELRFNLSHSAGFALYALSQRDDVGVDIEQIRDGFSETSIAEQFFSERECTTLRELPREAQSLAFFQCWTRKEAFVKANGHGLPFGLGDFDVSLEPGQPAALLSVHNDSAVAAEWSLFSLTPAPGFVAAVAIRGRECEFNLQSYAHS